MYSTVVDGGTYIIGICNGGSGAGGGTVQRFNAYETCIKALRVVSPAAKLGVVNDGGLARSEMISMAAS